MAGLSFNQCITAGHDAFPPTVINSTQPKVFTGGIPVLVDGDQITPHTRIVKPYDTHGGAVQPRTSKVYVTGKKAVQMADPISCGDTVAQSSYKVFIK
ncbi:baseplate puncturing device [Salmonella phage SEA1]|uniref:Phospholipase n=1 Tax=Salmonella phage vB_SnwM_CGG4-1 TaxID=1815631 RepID=A0A1B0VV88_9CAUD|nr:PAAR motif of membran proteins [Salmonella phage vB_SnwM_CGG4-1]ANA49492.1 hypothetical protein CGG41_137 [Salmonella phage vB_SnwM_CGG4-1]WKV23492.1 baseplate puncturing device [Salmonella phage SEA1]